ncbi:MAG: polyphenol oxidase family protein [Myxococcales bacterium]
MAAWLSSRLLAESGALHGFSTAAAGDMKDAAAREALLAAVAGGLPLATALQVHGARVVWGDATAAPEADALLVSRGLAAGVFTADCVPILLADPESQLAAAVHAGWRGTLAEAVTAAVRALLEAGARAASLRAAIGPHIRPCCYEVSPDLAATFAHRFGEGAVVRGPEPHLDLGELNRSQLVRAGLLEAHLELIDLCTACRREPRFYSYRRDGKVAGRQLSLVGWR